MKHGEIMQAVLSLIPLCPFPMCARWGLYSGLNMGYQMNINHPWWTQLIINNKYANIVSYLLLTAGICSRLMTMAYYEVVSVGAIGLIFWFTIDFLNSFSTIVHSTVCFCWQFCIIYLYVQKWQGYVVNHFILYVWKIYHVQSNLALL